MSQVTITNQELLEVFTAWKKTPVDGQEVTPEDAAERAEAAARYFVELLTEVRRGRK